MPRSYAIVAWVGSGMTTDTRAKLFSWLSMQDYIWASFIGERWEKKFCAQIWLDTDVHLESVDSSIRRILTSETSQSLFNLCTVDVFRVRHDWYLRFKDELAMVLLDHELVGRVPQDRNNFYVDFV